MKTVLALTLAYLLGVVLAAEESPSAIEDDLPRFVNWTTSLGDVVFPHALHVEDIGIDCESCHHETSAARLVMPHPEYFDDFWIDCKSCHGHAASPGEPRACSACHHASPRNIADETLSSKVVLHRSCWECHEVGQGPEASQSCQMCHPQPTRELASTMPEARP